MAGATNRCSVMAQTRVILFAEDDPTLRELYSHALEVSGLTVIATPTGDQALRMLDTLKPNLIILDIMMPNLNGVETCKRARKIVGSEIPIVFLTALDQLDTLRDCIEAGGDDYVMKSEPISIFAERIGYWLRETGKEMCLSRRRDEVRAKIMTKVRPAVLDPE